MKSLPLFVLYCLFSLISGFSIVSEDPVFRTYETLLEAKYGRERISFRTRWSRLIGGDDGSIPTIDLTVLSSTTTDFDSLLEPSGDSVDDDDEEETVESQDG
jgi:hypothetical protein